jgi:hypothetical protein
VVRADVREHERGDDPEHRQHLCDVRRRERELARHHRRAGSEGD